MNKVKSDIQSDRLFQKELTEWSTNLSMGWEFYGKSVPSFPKMCMKGLNKSMSQSPLKKIKISMPHTTKG